MNMDTMTLKGLTEFENRHVLIYGLDSNAEDLAKHIRESHPSIRIDAFLDQGCGCGEFLGVPVLSVDAARDRDMLTDANILIACQSPGRASNLFVDDKPACVRIVSPLLDRIFHAPAEPRRLTAQKTVTPFYLERGTPPIPALVSNAYISGSAGGDIIFELADFKRQEYVTWTMPSPGCALSLKKFSEEVPADALPMRM